ncbi:hypothetical protein DPX16_20770 [Anabarilius grahami]|uniref:Uncharacterized protein n=1 Tax=Anabarilius grahami TaxID=495550 RepID=A0A3N0ZAX3_ANAGA|nr:hypothetical protein DPX16_20770 [Anabarilius grahami]
MSPTRSPASTGPTKLKFPGGLMTNLDDVDQSLRQSLKRLAPIPPTSNQAPPPFSKNTAPNATQSQGGLSSFQPPPPPLHVEDKYHVGSSNYPRSPSLSEQESRFGDNGYRQRGGFHSTIPSELSRPSSPKVDCNLMVSIVNIFISMEVFEHAGDHWRQVEHSHTGDKKHRGKETRNTEGRRRETQREGDTLETGYTRKSFRDPYSLQIDTGYGSNEGEGTLLQFIGVDLRV